MTAQPPRFFLTPEEVDRMMTAFYAAIRRHAVLGPVFAAHVGTTDADWRAHEEKIGRFWKNAILREGGYSGSPMAVHRARPDILPEHFPLWLDLFDETAARVLRPEAAQAWSAIAHRIGRAFRMGVEEAHRSADAPPKLF
ncbi:group III truncated hemoglobin [Acidimangrovimonas sediminis]|uniref:group III truncated hemoglobin n=1 Tax=Acidimangrovimonas sediminis TaxID=2056283 RepID=UPI000C8100C9|nr:group III truncated hemoglobin [Acidimangrovimonas sediminis]